MAAQPDNIPSAASSTTDGPVTPEVVERSTFDGELDRLRIREKAHTREGDAIAAARRRLPMVAVDAATPLIGPNGPTTLLHAFEGRRQLLAYCFMWNPGRPAAEQCEGCTFYTSQVGEFSYLHSRDITFAVFCQGRNTASAGADPQASYVESFHYRDLGWEMPWYSAQNSLDQLLVGASSGCSISCATCGMATKCSSPTGRNAAAWSLWITATCSWISPPTAARNRGRTRHPAGHNGAPTSARRLARQVGRRLDSGRAGARSPSGRV